MTRDDKWNGTERRDNTVEVRELHALERRLGKYMRGIEASVNDLIKETTKMETLAKKYNGLYKAQADTMRLVQKNRVDLDRICDRSDWWSDLKARVGWVIGITATTLAMLQYLGVIG